MGDAVNDEAITEVQDGAVVIDPCTTTADAIGGVDTGACLASEERGYG
jgi:hypothetical protein